MTTRRNRRVQAPPLKEEEHVYTEDDYASPDAQGLSYGEVSYAEQMDWIPSYTNDVRLAPEKDPIEDAVTYDWSAAPVEDPLPEAESFPDLAEAEYVPFQMEGYDPAYESETDYMDLGDPLDEDYLTEEEQEELRRSTWQMLYNLADLAGIILGAAAILLLVMLLVSLLNWVAGDLTQSFSLLQKNF